MINMYICHNCAGNIIGRRHGDFLYSADGKYIGQFNAKNELYSCDKKYIGELATIYVDTKTGKTAMTENNALSVEKESVVYSEERLLVSVKKKGMQDDSIIGSQQADGFSEDLYETTRPVNVPVGYEDFEL